MTSWINNLWVCSPLDQNWITIIGSLIFKLLFVLYTCICRCLDFFLIFNVVASCIVKNNSYLLWPKIILGLKYLTNFIAGKVFVSQNLSLVFFVFRIVDDYIFSYSNLHFWFGDLTGIGPLRNLPSEALCSCTLITFTCYVITVCICIFMGQLLQHACCECYTGPR